MALNIFKPKDYSDSELVKGIQAHKESLTQFLYKKCRTYYDDNYKALFAVEATTREEIFEESFIKLWTDIEQKRIHIGDDGEVWRINKKGEDKPMTTRLHTFLMDIAKNVFRVWLRNQKEVLIDDVFRGSKGSDDDDEPSYEGQIGESKSVWENTEQVVTSDSDYFTQALASNDQRGLIQELVQEAIMRLSATCRDILTMFYYEEMTLDDILAQRGENTSKDGLKTGKYKCMKRFETDIRENFAKYHVRY